MSGDTALIVLNSDEPYRLAISLNGAGHDAWGRSGDRPGELGNPMALVSGADAPAVHVYDLGRRAILGVGSPLELGESWAATDSTLREVRIASFENAGTGGGRPWLRRDGTGSILLARSPIEGQASARLWTVDLVALQRDGSTRMVFPLADQLADRRSFYGDATEFLPFPLWALCPSGSIALYDPTRNDVRRFSGSQDRFSEAQLPPPIRKELTVDRMFRMSYERFVASAPPEACAMRLPLQP